MLVIFFLVCLTSTWCAPQSRRQPANQVQPNAPAPSVSPPIPIISHSEIVNGDGSFNFSYETGNGIHVQEGGYIKKLPLPQGHSALNSDEVDADGGGISVQVITGSYSYKTPNGTEISLTYIADENGFQPKGAHLPTPPPIPPEILKSLQLLPKSEENLSSKSIQESASNTEEITDYNSPSNYDLLRRK